MILTIESIKVVESSNMPGYFYTLVSYKYKGESREARFHKSFTDKKQITKILKRL